MHRKKLPLATQEKGGALRQVPVLGGGDSGSRCGHPARGKKLAKKGEHQGIQKKKETGCIEDTNPGNLGKGSRGWLPGKSQ